MAKAWFYHKEFPHGEVFERGEEPPGSVEHPDDIKKAAPKKKTSKSEAKRVEVQTDEQRKNDH